MSDKPLGHKSYGSIPHLPGSRRGPADKDVNEGQYRICCERTRDRHDLIIVQEKLDGSNVSIARIDGQIVPLTRAGYRAESSKYEQHHLFASWVHQDWTRWLTLLNDGERLCGEWLAQAHGTRYVLGDMSPFVAFDLMVGTERATYDELTQRMELADVPTAPLLSYGPPLSIERAMFLVGAISYYGALDPVEGAVWRVERDGRVDFLAKYVRSDKVDGCYLPEVSGGDAIWNWHPAQVAL